MTLRPRGVWLVASLELRQRVRSKRWYVALGCWLVFLLAMSGIVFGLVMSVGGIQASGLRLAGQIVFSGAVMLLVFATLLVSPAFASGAINGDRSAGTLATLQATLLSPLEIVTGKVLAGWITGLAFLVAALPSIIPSAIAAGVGPFYLLRVLTAIAAITLFITMIGMGLSSITSRQLGSVVLTYLVVLGTTTILPFLYVCSLTVLHEYREVTTYTMTYDPPSGTDESTYSGTCRREVTGTQVPRTDLALPLLFVNPFVIVADQAPPIDEASDLSGDEEIDLLRLIATGMRHLAQPLHPSHFNSCSPDSVNYPQDLGTPTSLPVWPFGVALWAFTGAGAMAIATWRVRTPMRHVGAGTRIA